MNVLKALLLTLVIAAAALAQTQTPPTTPNPPACLSGPVTQGNVTLSCSAVDGTAKSGTYAIPSDVGALGFYVFQVKITSADPNTVAVLVNISVWEGDNPSYQRTVAIAPTDGKFGYTFQLNSGYDGTAHVPIPPVVSAIAVQELKASSSQSF